MRRTSRNRKTEVGSKAIRQKVLDNHLQCQNCIPVNLLSLLTKYISSQNWLPSKSTLRFSYQNQTQTKQQPVTNGLVIDMVHTLHTYSTFTNSLLDFPEDSPFTDCTLSTFRR